MESRSSTTSQMSDIFTRDPKARYLTPVPPKPLIPSRLGDLCRETYTVSTITTQAPRSATYPVSTRPVSPLSEQRSRSAGTSPYLASSPISLDLKSLKENTTTSKRPADARDVKPSVNVRGLQIGTPVLISTTAEGMHVVPLPSQVGHVSPSSVSARIKSRMKDFSPLGSHPVDASSHLATSLAPYRGRTSERLRSHTHSNAKASMKIPEGRVRANSADTRRTKHYHLCPNEPWASSPRLPDCPVVVEKPVPVLQRPTLTIEPPSNYTDIRPMSRHGPQKSSSLRNTPLDKDLPALPRYLVPAPLFACNSTATNPVARASPPSEPSEETHEFSRPPSPHERKSHFSTWSADSVAFSSSASEASPTNSPTSSSSTSTSSAPGSPRRDSRPLSFATRQCQTSPQFSKGRPEFGPKTDDTILFPTRSSEVATAAPFPLPTIPLISIEPTVTISETTQRRHAACFGGYPGPTLSQFSLAEAQTDATNSPATTNTKGLSSTYGGRPSIHFKRSSSTSQLEQLMSDFAFLGQVVQ
jgi:hypothetical protein